jgi:hypothetical protein
MSQNHEVETCQLPSTTLRRTGAVWACWCGRLYRKSSGYGGNHWKLIEPYLNEDKYAVIVKRPSK